MFAYIHQIVILGEWWIIVILFTRSLRFLIPELVPCAITLVFGRSFQFLRHHYRNLARPRHYTLPHHHP